MRSRALVLLLLIAVAGCSSGDKDDAREPSTGKIVDGSTKIFATELEDAKGAPVVVNFWATWCDPCKAEMPRLVDAARKYEGKVAFLGVDVQDDPIAADRFVRRYGMNFKSLTDRTGQIRNKEKILGLPVTQFYDSEGELALQHQGEIKAGELEDKIEEVLRL